MKLEDFLPISPKEGLPLPRGILKLPGFIGSQLGASFVRLPYYVHTGTTPVKGFITWTKVMAGQFRTQKFPWRRQ